MFSEGFLEIFGNLVVIARREPIRRRLHEELSGIGVCQGVGRRKRGRLGGQEELGEREETRAGVDTI